MTVFAALVFKMHSSDTEGERWRPGRGRNALHAGCGTTLVIFLLAAFGYLAWANTLPAPELDRRMLPSPNGYEACAAAVASLPTPTRTRARRSWDVELAWSPSDLKRMRPGLAALSAAVRLPYLSPSKNPDRDRELNPYREACRQLAAAARVELATGHQGVAMNQALDAVELGAKLGRGGTWIESAVGDRCVQIGQRAAEPCVPRLTQGELRAAGSRLDSILAQLPDPAEVMSEEHRLNLLGTRDLLAGRYSPALGPASGLAAVKERTLLFVYPKSWAYRRVDRYWRALEVELRKPYPARKAPTRPYPHVYPAMGHGEFPRIASLQFPFARVRAQLRLLRAEVALREYRARHGAYPAALAQLVPTSLAAVPVDPFSDQPLHYRREGDTFVLYSVGPDLVDNGGSTTGPHAISLRSKGDLPVGELVVVPLKGARPAE